MMGCSILIGHINTLYYLKFCIEQIRKYEHSEIPQEIILMDQSAEPVGEEIRNRYGESQDIKLIKLPKIDLGYTIDTGITKAKYDYFCTLDIDAFPIHKNWLYLPIKLIEKYKFSFVGHSTGLELCYQDMGKFYHLNNYYRISRTELARKLSETVGFIRPEDRERVGYVPKDDSWGNHHADNGVVVQWYTERQSMGDKLSLAMSSFVGATNKMGYYGMNIDDLVFHMVFSGKDNVDNMLGDAFLELREQMIRNGLSDTFIRELIRNSTELKSIRKINGNNVSPEIDEFIDNVKNS